jgi:hypothetical protein
VPRASSKLTDHSRDAKSRARLLILVDERCKYSEFYPLQSPKSPRNQGRHREAPVEEPKTRADTAKPRVPNVLTHEEYDEDAWKRD